VQRRGSLDACLVLLQAVKILEALPRVEFANNVLLLSFSDVANSHAAPLLAFAEHKLTLL
jgi:hypothetical protein